MKSCHICLNIPFIDLVPANPTSVLAMFISTTRIPSGTTEVYTTMARMSTSTLTTKTIPMLTNGMELYKFHVHLFSAHSATLDRTYLSRVAEWAE